VTGAPPPPADLASGLVAFLREALGEPALELADGLTAVSGGFDTRIFAFRLAGVSPSSAGPLILRLLGPHHAPARALREQVVQNTLANSGYPAPRVLCASADVSTLGGAFLVMERVPGRALIEDRIFNLGAVLVDLQARLHALDADALLEALGRSGPALRARDVTFDGYLEQLGSRIAAGRLDGLEPAMRWLRSARPPEPARRAICHGDFHPQNVLAEKGRVTGVLDWPNALVADPAYDVASTRIILRFAPVELMDVSAPLRLVVRAARVILARRYLSGYRRRRPIDPGVLAYYEAASIMRALVRAAEQRRRPDGPTNPLDASSFADDLAAHFASVSGIQPGLPPRPVS